MSDQPPRKIRFIDGLTSIDRHLRTLLQISKVPPSQFLKDYIGTIKSKIEVEIGEILTKKSFNENETQIIKKHKDLMHERLETFEKECLSNFEQTKLGISFLELIKFHHESKSQVDLVKIKEINVVDFDYSSNFNEIIKIEHNILSKITQYKCILFNNKWVFFKKRKNFGPDNTDFGKLIFKIGVTNEKIVHAFDKVEFYEDLIFNHDCQLNDKLSLIKWNLSLNLFEINVEKENPIIQIEFYDLYALKQINLNSCSIKMITPLMFYGLENAESLCMQRSRLMAISKQGFTSLTNLRKLDLSWNRLDKIESNCFSDLNQLEELVLSENQINLIEGNAFSSLKNLKKLCLDNNRLRKVEQETFRELGNLEYLNLESNKLRNICEVDFSSQNNLKILNLSFNEIDHVEPDMFSSLVNLKELYLKNNSIRLICNRAFHGLNKLDLLELSHNLIDSFEKGTFTNLSCLKTLYLNHNSVNIIDDSIYDDLDQLEDLYL